MAKRNTGWTEAKIARYIKEGRGQGDLSNYKPWLTTQDVPSRGRVHRLKGWKTERIYHFLSDLEYKYFLILEWSDEVIDIREQFPLDREMTTTIAEKVGIKHPEDPTTKTPIVMTTDFYVTVRKMDKIINLARTIKPSKELNSSNVIAKFEIERLYWEEKNVDWGIVTEEELDKDLVENIKFLHSSKLFPENLDNNLMIPLLHSLTNQTESLAAVLNEFDYNYNLSPGSALSLFKYLLANKKIKTDIKQSIDISLPTSILTFDLEVDEKVRWAT